MKSTLNPAVDNRLMIVDGKIAVRLSLETVDVGIKHEKSISIPERPHKPTLHLVDGRRGKAHRHPWVAVRIKHPADGVRPFTRQDLVGIDNIAEVFRHFDAILVENVSHHDAIIVGRRVKKARGDRMQTVKPPARLVDRLGDKVGRHTLLENFLVLKRIMILSKGHRTGIIPTVDNFGNTCHHAIALRTTDVHPVDHRLMKLNLFGTVGRHRFQFINGTDHVQVMT